MLHTVGNKALLDIGKTAFLCSRKIPSSVLLKTYDWVLHNRNADKCIISGFHSPVEKEMLTYFLRGRQPVILALAKGISDPLADPILAKGVSENKILIVSQFPKTVTRASEQTATKRNELMLKMAENLFVPYAEKGGKVFALAAAAIQTKFPVFTLNVPENEQLLSLGAEILDT